MPTRSGKDYDTSDKTGNDNLRYFRNNSDSDGDGNADNEGHPANPDLEGGAASPQQAVPVPPQADIHGQDIEQLVPSTDIARRQGDTGTADTGTEDTPAQRADDSHI